MKSCLTIVVLIVVAGLVYNMYRKSYEPVTPELSGEYSPQFKKSIIASLENFIVSNPDIQRMSLDGSILDLHYTNKVAKNQYRQDASLVAESFSRNKLQLLDDGDVTVRCIFNNLIQIEVIAENGRVVKITEL